MKEYSYKQIKCFNKVGIKFCDGETIRFDECRLNWAKSKGINIKDTYCVADRNIYENNPYYLFYSNEKTKIIFKRNRYIFKNSYKKKFMKIQIALNNFGYSSYDCS